MRVEASSINIERTSERKVLPKKSTAGCLPRENTARGFWPVSPRSSGTKLCFPCQCLLFLSPYVLTTWARAAGVARHHSELARTAHDWGGRCNYRCGSSVASLRLRGAIKTIATTRTLIPVVFPKITIITSTTTTTITTGITSFTITRYIISITIGAGEGLPVGRHRDEQRHDRPQ